MELAVQHQTTYRYATPVNQVALLLRLRPMALDNQVIKAWQVTVNGQLIDSFQPNAYGDAEALHLHRGPVSELEITASGVVETFDRNGVLSGFGQEPPLGVFLRQTELTRPDAAVLALAQSVAQEPPIPRLHALSERAHKAIAYAPGSTSAATTVAEALAQGQGVCQDHAHLFVSAARSLGIPARYVAGYLLADEAGHAVRETHAWAEAWVDGLGWIGFDPTNRLCVTEQHVRLCVGLDAHDAAPVRGSVQGSTEIGIQAQVVVTPAEAQQQQQ